MIFRGVIVKSLQDNSNECRGHSVWMRRGSWSRRRHMKVARFSTEVGREVVRQVRQIVMQYLLFRCSRGCVRIIHEETDGWRMHISWGRKAWCGAHLVGEKSTFCMKVSRDRDTEADLIEREKLLEVFLGRAEAVAEVLDGEET
ncbi:hypothetical protein DY000_02041453 [Brassica cretica]|uniref:Uncharacterized protein n=1 Tax=Brassica cretica TaxID=69181 RepID=A0ABQ7BFP5_BRACR|nr:hypothetical protein DY000_02041453 [Brassica cretica]